MPVTLILNERNRQDQVLLHQMRLLQRKRYHKTLNPFPFSLLEQLIRAVLDGMEMAVRLFVVAVARALTRRNGVRSR